MALQKIFCVCPCVFLYSAEVIEPKSPSWLNTATGATFFTVLARALKKEADAILRETASWMADNPKYVVLSDGEMVLHLYCSPFLRFSLFIRL